MGTRRRLSTLGLRRPANWSFVASFSGKLCAVMPNSSESAAGDRALAAPNAELKPREVGGMPRPAMPREEAAPPEVGGREGPEPTRFGDWELRGRCIDF
jgi:hypothetical protein